MADYLDAPTIYREGFPTLGVPVLSLTYRSQLDENTPLASVLVLLQDHERQIAALLQAVAYFDLPWYTKLWRSLRGTSRAAQRRHALSVSLGFFQKE
jgi:hypothetical protein